MSDSTPPYRIWVAGASEWLPGPAFPSLDDALSNAHRLARTGEVAIELPDRHWHTFNENGESFLGPDHALAAGSETDSASRARAAVTAPPSGNSAYSLNFAKVRRVRRTSAVTIGPIASPYVVTPNATQSMLPTAEPEVMRAGRERRDNSRYQASLILTEPNCSIENKRTDIIDISESGLKLVLPTGIQANVSSRVMLVFSGRHGFFELDTRTRWANGSYLGVHIEEVSTNLVGQMFLRKMIAKWRERERRRAKFRA